MNDYLNLAARGYRVAYHPGESNACPSCGRSNWHVGRQLAECAFCEGAIPLATSAYAERPASFQPI